MQTIYKYELDIPLPLNVKVTKLTTPEMTPLSVGEQNGKLVLWGQVDTDPEDESPWTADNDTWEIAVVGTGADLSFMDDSSYEYTGTVQMKDGYVWHVYAALI